jgi:uncharacterized protein YbjT (DUF2867 family)
MSETKTVLVAGATGRFGEIAEKLIDRGHRVRAGTRNPSSPAAQRLAGLGAEPVVADFDDPGSLAAAARGVDAVFAGGTAHHVGPQGEANHGRNLAAAVAVADVPHLVFVSGEGAAPDSPLPLFQAKWQVEEAIEACGVAHTILAPTYLMENLFNPWNLPSLRAGIYPSPIAVDRPLQQTAIADLLELAALAIERPDELAGRRIEVASDELTGEQAATAISEVIPRTLEAGAAPEEVPPPVRFLFGWLESTGHQVDIEALHGEFPEVGWQGYDVWAAEQREHFRELCAHLEPV